MVEIRGVTKRFGQVVALNNVSLEISDGEFFALIGPSGCGKTTMLRTIAGLETPDSGSVHIDGKDMTGIPTARREISLVFQNFALFPHKSVWDNIIFGLKMKHESGEIADDKVRESMKLVGLEGLGDRLPRELSGGQQQRVALARSLVVEPKVLLLDEPLGNIDFKLQKKMEVELKFLQEKVGITSIYVTHNQEQAMILGHRIAVMNQGINEQIGAPEEIYSKPKTVFVARFVGEINMLKGTITSTKGDIATVETEFGRFTAPSPEALDSGTKVAYAVRPEKMRIGPDADACTNRLEIESVKMIYKGSEVEYILDLGNGQEFKSLAQHPTVKEGKGPAFIGWNSSDAIILEKPSLIEGADIDRVLLGA